MTHVSKDVEDGIIDLRSESSDGHEPEFRINRSAEKEEIENRISSTPASPSMEDAASKPYDKVKVNFEKFVTLIANHDIEGVFEKHIDEDVIVSTDLLADLANSHEDVKENKVPAVFFVGLLIGIALTWFLLS